MILSPNIVFISLHNTEILSNILKEEGELIVASFGNHNPNEYLRQIHIDFTNYFSKNHNIFGKFKVVDFYKKDYY